MLYLRFPADRMADSDIEFEDDLPDWSDDDDKPKCASAAKERRTEPPLLLTSSDDLLEAVASQLTKEPVAETTVLTRQQNVFLSNLSHLFSVLIPLVRLPSSAPLPDCEALADLCVSALWVQAVRCALPTSVRVHMEANMQQQQFDLQPSHFQRILCHLLGVGAADIPPPPQVPTWPPHHRQQQEAALVQWLSNYPQLVEHPRLRAWPEGGADALEAAVMRPKAACRNRRRHGHHGCARTPHMAPCGDLPIVAARAAVAPRSATDDGNACRVHQARASLVCRARRTPRYAACPHTERASPLAPLTRAAGKGSKCGQVLRGAVCSQPERHRQAHHLLGAGGAPAAVDSSPPRRRAEQCPVMHWSKVASIADEDHDRGSQRAS